MNEGDLGKHEPMVAAHAYTAYMAWLALYGSDAQIAAAYLVNFPALGKNCGRMSRALTSVFSMREEVAFFDLFANTPGDFEANSLAVIQYRLDRGEDPVLIKRAVRLLQGYELMYWDAIHLVSVPA